MQGTNNLSCWVARRGVCANVIILISYWWGRERLHGNLGPTVGPLAGVRCFVEARRKGKNFSTSVSHSSLSFASDLFESASFASIAKAKFLESFSSIFLGDSATLDLKGSFVTQPNRWASFSKQKLAWIKERKLRHRSLSTLKDFREALRHAFACVSKDLNFEQTFTAEFNCALSRFQPCRIEVYFVAIDPASRLCTHCSSQVKFSTWQ